MSRLFPAPLLSVALLVLWLLLIFRTTSANRLKALKRCTQCTARTVSVWLWSPIAEWLLLWRASMTSRR